MEIRLLKTEELPKLQKFLHEHWKANHILSTNKKLMDYQHWNGNGYNFVIAIEKGEILCILGFIPTSQYDPKITRKDIWLAIWKRTDQPASKGLGIKLLDYIEDTIKPDTIGTVGMNENTEQLYLDRGWKTGVMNHYYLPNIGNIALYDKADKFLNCVYSGMKFSTIPQKSLTYINTRYRFNPFYKYLVYTVHDCVFVIRKINVRESFILRIVDIFGELPENIQYTLQYLLMRENSDYIDCMNFGIPKEKFLKMGLYEKPDNLILPNWFEPFTPEHKPILFSYKAPSVKKTSGGECWEEENYVIFKGDSDQDRPNII